MKKIICIVCARKNSKGIRNKNILKIFNKSLIEHTLLQAKNSKIFYKIIVSSDSKKILKISKKYANLLIKRPSRLASDSAGKLDAILHALYKAENKFKEEFDTIVDLDVTAPLRNVYDIKKSIKIFFKKKLDNLFSVCESRKNPYFNMVEIKNKKVSLVKKVKNINYVRRQNTPKVYDVNASIYVWKKKILEKKLFFNRKTGIYLMPFSRSIDIDTLDDLKLVKFFMKKNNYKH